MRTILLAAVLTACTGSANYWTAYHPVSGHTTQDKAGAVQHAVIAITDAGREVESSDGATGIVLSKWFSGDGFSGDDTRFRVRVVVGDDGRYDIAALCQRKSVVTSAWGDDCDADKRPRFVVETVGKVEAALR